MPVTTPSTNDVYTISRLNREVRSVLEDVFPTVWVQGEISNLARPSSGHMYFTLKDNNAQVYCAMFRNRQSGLRFQPENGMWVLIRANISLYEGRGEFQLITESMQLSGDGVLQLAFEQLKRKLAKEELFAEKYKKALPRFPVSIGVITSPTGAAIRDVLSVLKRRYPSGRIIVYPVPVQGKDAGKQIAAAIRLANQRQECDVLILTRGGGSLEDLLAFNEECVARAVFNCSLPVVSGVGHEIDFSIADFVADQRAPTPSVAAELVSPDSDRILQQLNNFRARMVHLQENIIMHMQRHVDFLSRRIPHPGQHLQQLDQRAMGHLMSLVYCMKRQLSARELLVTNLNMQINTQNPIYQIKQQQQALTNYRINLAKAIKYQLINARHFLTMISQKLEIVSPLSTLERGYAIVTYRSSGAIIKHGAQLKTGDKITIRLINDEIDSTVDAIHKK